MKNILFFFLFTTFLSGCSTPKQLLTTIQKYPCNLRTVDIISDSSQLNQTSQLIGKIVLYDTTKNARRSYNHVRQSAEESAGKIGGHTILITKNTEPSFIDHSYYISGDIYRTMSSLERKPDYFQNHTIYNSNTHTHHIYAHVSYAKEISTFNEQYGIMTEAGYNWIHSSGIGIGVGISTYYQHQEDEKKHYSSGSQLIEIDDTPKVRCYYFAPSLIYKRRLTSVISIQMGAGVGHVLFTKSESDNKNGFGYHTELGLNFKISPAVSFKLNSGIKNMLFKSDYSNKRKLSILTFGGGLGFQL